MNVCNIDDFELSEKLLTDVINSLYFLSFIWIFVGIFIGLVFGIYLYACVDGFAKSIKTNRKLNKVIFIIFLTLFLFMIVMTSKYLLI